MRQIHLEAVRGLAALMVVMAHFAAAFYPSTLVGSSYRPHAAWESWIATTPLAFLIASHFAVCLFFILSGYVLSLPYFGESAKDTTHLLSALVKRPFRLAGMVMVSILASFVLMRTGGYFHLPVSEITHSVPWLADNLPKEAPGLGRFLLDLFLKPFAGGAWYNPPLWTIELELYGSIITFLFVLLFRASNLRWVAYGFAFVAFYSQLYQGFIFGILCADVARNHPAWISSWSRPAVSFLLLVLGFLPASHPHYIKQTEQSQNLYGWFFELRGLGGGWSMLGAILLFAALLLSPAAQSFLTRPLFAFLGRISYALYAIHYVFLCSFSSWLFLQLQDGLGYHQSVMLTVLISLLLLAGISLLLARWVDGPSIRLANAVAERWRRSLKERAFA